MNLFSDKSIVKRDFSGIYHQKGFILNVFGKNFDFIFVETSNYYQIGNTYFQFDLPPKKNSGRFEDDNTVLLKLTIDTFAHLVKGHTIMTTGGMKIKVIQYIGPVSTNLSVLMSKIGDLSSYLIKILKIILGTQHSGKN